MSKFGFSKPFDNGLKPREILYTSRKCYYHVCEKEDEIEIQYSYGLDNVFQKLRCFDKTESRERIAEIVKEVLAGITPEQEAILRKYIDIYTKDDMCLIIKNLNIRLDENGVEVFYPPRSEATKFDESIDTELTDLFLELNQETSKEVKFSKAVGLYAKCYNVLGRYHCNTISVLHSICDLIRDTEQIEDKLTIDTELYRYYKENYGNSHLYTGWTIVDIAWDLVDLGKAGDAIELSLYVYEREKEKETISNLLKWDLILMGTAYKKKGRTGLAKRSFDECYGLLGEVDKENADYAMICLEELAGLCREKTLKNHVQAMAYDTEKMRIIETFFKDDYKKLIFGLSDMAHDCCLLEKYEQAFFFQSEALRISIEKFGDKDQKTIDQQLNFCYLLSAVGKYKQAAVIEEAMYQLCEEMYGETDQRCLLLMDDIIFDMEKAGARDEALKLAKISFERRLKLLGAQHEETQTAYRQYVELRGGGTDGNRV